MSLRKTVSLLWAASTALAAVAQSSSNATVPLPGQKGFEVVIVYEKPAAGCTPKQCSAQTPVLPTLPASASPSGSSSGSFTKGSSGNSAGSSSGSAHGQISDSDPAFSQDAPAIKLPPGVHPSIDTSSPTNVIPVKVGDASEHYYGSANASSSGYYGLMTYHFTAPSVNLDHCDHVPKVVFTNDSCRMTFASEEAFAHAKGTWTHEMILIAYDKICQATMDGDRCFFRAASVEFLDGLVVVATGSFHKPVDICSSGRAQWGQHGGRSRPQTSATRSSTVAATTRVSTLSGTTRVSTVPGSLATAGFSTYTGAASTSSSFAAQSSAASSSAGAATNGATIGKFGSSDTSSCVAPVDSKHGLPTACLGDYFDDDLDAALGYQTGLNSTLKEYLDLIAPGLWYNDEDLSDSAQDFGDALNFNDTVLEKRLLGLKISLPKGLTKGLERATGKKIPPISVGKALNFVPGVGVLKMGVQLFTDKKHKIDKSIDFSIPNPKDANAQENKFQDKELKQVNSPWGPAILLGKWGHKSGSKSKRTLLEPEVQTTDLADRALTERELELYIAIYCVGCGTSGSLGVSGIVDFNLDDGIKSAFVEIRATSKLTLKIGVEAMIRYKHTIEKTVFRYGHPALTFGPVVIGPYVEVGIHVVLEALAQGKVLVGAEMGVQGAYAYIDLMDSKKNQNRGFTPSSKPIFEADGELMLSASLGLPIGLKVGLVISDKWKLSGGVVDEPSIKAVAQVAASVGLDESGQLTGGFKEIDGCKGILAQLTFRNQLWGDLMGKNIGMIHDTKDISLMRECFELGKKSSTGGTIDAGSSTGGSTGGSTSTDNNGGSNNGNTGGSNTGSEDDDSNPTGGTETGNTGGTNAGSEDGDNTGSNTGSNTGGNTGTGNTGGGTSETDEDDASKSGTSGGGGSNTGNTGNDDPTDIPAEGIEDYRRRSMPAPLRPRASLNSTSATNSTDTDDEPIVDLSDDVPSNGTTAFYELADIPNKPYNTTDGYEHNLLTVADGETIFITCGDGSIYAAPSDADIDYCTTMWSTYEDVVVSDDGRRMMHYYSNTMDAVGISRLVVSTEDRIPAGGVPLVLVMKDVIDELSEDNDASAEDDKVEPYFVALDINYNVFFPILCGYSDNNSPKLFLAADPAEGIKLLQSGEFEYSITNGPISDCIALELVMGTYDTADSTNGTASAKR